MKKSSVASALKNNYLQLAAWFTLCSLTAGAVLAEETHQKISKDQSVNELIKAAKLLFKPNDNVELKISKGDSKLLLSDIAHVLAASQQENVLHSITLKIRSSENPLVTRIIDAEIAVMSASNLKWADHAVVISLKDVGQ